MFRFDLTRFGRFFSANVFVEDDEIRFLTTTNLCVLFLPLPIRSPEIRLVTTSRLCDPQCQDVDATILVSAGHVFGNGLSRIAMPRHREVAGAGFDGGDDAISDLLVNVRFGIDVRHKSLDVARPPHAAFRWRPITHADEVVLHRRPERSEGRRDGTFLKRSDREE